MYVDYIPFYSVFKVFYIMLGDVGFYLHFFIFADDYRICFGTQILVYFCRLWFQIQLTYNSRLSFSGAARVMNAPSICPRREKDFPQEQYPDVSVWGKGFSCPQGWQSFLIWDTCCELLSICSYLFSDVQPSDGWIHHMSPSHGLDEGGGSQLPKDEDISWLLWQDLTGQYCRTVQHHHTVSWWE